MSPTPVVTELDAARIRDLGSLLPRRDRALAALDELIGMVTDEAEIVPGAHVPADVVTVNSVVSFRDGLTGMVYKVTLVYPNDVVIGERRISILSPVGRALLGRRVGALTQASMPDGTSRELRVVELHYQPEAAGDFAR